MSSRPLYSPIEQLANEIGFHFMKIVEATTIKGNLSHELLALPSKERDKVIKELLQEIRIALDLSCPLSPSPPPRAQTPPEWQN